MTQRGPIASRIQLLRENEAILVVCTSTALVMLGQGFVGPILPLFAKTFGVSAAAVGASISAFALARLVFNVPAGFVADRWGRRVLLVGGPLLSGIGNILSGTSPSFELLLAWRFVAGIGSAIYMTGATIAITDIATDDNRGRLMALNQGALLFGVTLGPAVGGVSAELAGLRMPFYLVGGSTFAAAAWNLLRVPETRPAVGTAEESTTKGEEEQGGAWSVLLVPSFLLVGLVSAAVFFARSGRQTLLPLMGSEQAGLSEGEIGGIFASMALINLLLTFPAGAIVDRFGAKAAIVPSAGVSMLAYLLFVPVDSPPAFWGASLVLALGSGLLGPAPAAFAAEVAPEERRGAAMGIFRSLSDAGFVLGPPTVGFLVDRAGFGWGFSANGGVLLTTALLFAWLARRPDPGSDRPAVREEPETGSETARADPAP
ncbi:MAG: MFS transporter [Dehalococcoidia bacterium]